MTELVLDEIRRWNGGVIFLSPVGSGCAGLQQIKQTVGAMFGKNLKAKK
jgi:hypothetical protein